jgi:hypothetical protein
MEPFAYRPLLQAPNSTRLLQIQPSAKESDIHCFLHDHTIRLDRASGPYEALSYVWGDATEMKRVYVRDALSAGRRESQSSYLDVTVNLYIALQRLRDFLPTDYVDRCCEPSPGYEVGGRTLTRQTRGTVLGLVDESSLHSNDNVSRKCQMRTLTKYLALS